MKYLLLALCVAACGSVPVELKGNAESYQPTAQRPAREDGVRIPEQLLWAVGLALLGGGGGALGIRKLLSSKEE